MPVLPLIDLLIMVGWTSLMGAGLLKAIYLSTMYRPTVVGLGPGDFLVFAGVCLMFAMALAARTWVKYHEPRLMASRRVRTRDGFGAEELGGDLATLHTARPAASRVSAEGS